MHESVKKSCCSVSEQDPLRSRIAALFLITGIFFLNYMSRVVLGPLLLSLEQSFQLSVSSSGYLFLILSVGYSLSLLNAGQISSRITHKNTIALSALVAGIALSGVGISQNVPTLMIMLFVTGMGLGMYIPSGLRTITSFIPATHLGKAFAVHEFAPIISFLAAPLLVEILLYFSSWRGVFFVLSILCLLAAFSYFKIGRGGDVYGHAPHFVNIKDAFASKEFWIITICFSLVVGAEFGIYNMIPVFLVKEKGFDREWANLFLCITRVAALASALGAGYLVDKLGTRRSLFFFIGLSGLSTLLIGWGPKWWIYIFLFLQPLFVVGFFPAGLTTLSAIGSSINEMSISLTLTITSVIGTGVVPAVLALLGDHYSFAVAFSVLGTAMLSILLGVGKLQNVT